MQLIPLPVSREAACLELHQYSRRFIGAMNNSKVDIHFRVSDTDPLGYKSDDLPHDHGHFSFPQRP